MIRMVCVCAMLFGLFAGAGSTLTTYAEINGVYTVLDDGTDDPVRARWVHDDGAVNILDAVLLYANVSPD